MPEYNHIVYTDRTTAKPDMVPIEKTQMLGQVHGECCRNPNTNKWQLTSSLLPCACPICRINPLDILNCHYRQIRKPKKIDIKMKGESINNNLDGIYGYMVITVSELRTELNGRGIATPKRLNKRDLVALLTETVDLEYANDDDGDEVLDVNEVDND